MCERDVMDIKNMLRRTAGIWGPATFVAAAVGAARLQPDYSHRSRHISGLAAQGERSAWVMVPGFLALGASNAIMPMPGARLTVMARAVAGTTVAAGLIPASQPRCPQPFVDPEATATDTGHSVASIATFVLWTAMPIVASRTAGPTWYRLTSRSFGTAAIVGCGAAAVTTAVDSSVKGIAQRIFLGVVFSWSALTAVVGLCSRESR